MTVNNDGLIEGVLFFSFFFFFFLDLEISSWINERFLFSS